MDRGAGESRCIHGAQLPSPVAQRRGLFVVFGDDGGLPFAAGPLDLLVEVIGVRHGTDPLFDGRQARLDHADAG